MDKINKINKTQETKTITKERREEKHMKAIKVELIKNDYIIKRGSFTKEDIKENCGLTPSKFMKQITKELTEDVRKNWDDSEERVYWEIKNEFNNKTIYVNNKAEQAKVDEEVAELRAKVEEACAKIDWSKVREEVEEMKKLRESELYKVYKYLRTHEDERTQLTYAARTFVEFELGCLVDEEEQRAKLERAYENDSYEDDENDVIIFLYNEIEAGRTAEAKRIIEEHKAKEEEESRKMNAEAYALNRVEELEEIQTVVAEEQRTAEAQEAAEEEAAEQAAAEYNKYIENILKKEEEKNMNTLREERREAIERLEEVNTITPYTDDVIDELYEITSGLDIDELVYCFEEIWEEGTIFEYLKEDAEDLDSIIYRLAGCSGGAQYYRMNAYGNFEDWTADTLDYMIDCIIMTIEQAE